MLWPKSLSDKWRGSIAGEVALLAMVLGAGDGSGEKEIGGCSDDR